MILVESPSPNFNDRKHPVDMLVLHYTGMKDGATALARMCDPEAEVSAHYMVEEDGRIFALVPEAKRAWHAGRGRWQGDEDINSRSIGVEIVNGGHDFFLPDYPDVQIAAVIELGRQIINHWNIPQTRIVAHSDIAPGRKEDPGERFPWARLADAGIGLWPEHQDGASEPMDEAGLISALGRIGYPAEGDMGDPGKLFLAFQRRWLPGHLSGRPDEKTGKRIIEVERSYAAHSAGS